MYVLLEVLGSNKSTMYRVSQKKVSDKIFLGYYLLVLTTGQLTSMPARRRGLEPRSHDLPGQAWQCRAGRRLGWSPQICLAKSLGDQD